jgi:hypothetical protein
MAASRSAIACAIVVAAVVVGSIIQGSGQQTPRQGAGRLELEPVGSTLEAVFPYLEGWYRNDDGSTTIMLGYNNRNTTQELDIPIGPNNRIEPGGPDRGQPTHFMPRQNWAVFTITVPKDFGNQKLTWTLTANNLTNSTTIWLNPLYYVEPFRHAANGNTPPQITFSENGRMLQGPPRDTAHNVSGTVNQPVPLTVWATDLPATFDATTSTFLTPEEAAAKAAQAAAARGAGAQAGGAGSGAAGRGAGQTSEPASIAVINDQVFSRGGRGGGGGGRGGSPADVTIIWSKYRGPGAVTFSPDRIPLRNEGNVRAVMKAETTATFTEPGEYILRVVANDASGDGGGGNQCCWTTAHVRVAVSR